MTIAFLVFQKLISFFLLMCIGLFLMQKEIFNKDVTLALSKLLTRFVAPSLFISSFMANEFSVEKLKLLGLMILSAFVILILRVIVVHFLFPRSRNIDQYATLFANVGFMGTPLALAVGGKEAVFFISGFVVANQFAQWTYGIYLITRDSSLVNVKGVFLNPATIATVIGIVLFCLPIELPAPISDAIESFASLNTPLSTVVLGTYFYQVKFRDIFLYPPAYWTAFCRLFLTSSLSVLIIWLLPIDEMAVKLALTIASCAPAAQNTALLSQVYGGDYEYGSRLVLLTTTLSIITIPLMMLLAGHLYL